MSYILDALQKIEHEKNKKARLDGRISISGDLFHERKQPVNRGRVWKLLVLIVAASLVTFAVTWLLLQGKNTKSAAVTLPVAPLPHTPVNSPVAPLDIPLPIQSKPVAAPPAAASAPVTVMPKNSGTVADNDSSAQAGQHSKTRIKPQSTPLKQLAYTAPVPNDIKLSGIAWQDERVARRAVINGFLLKEGAVVSGATITDIQADRVRFSSSAGLFEIKLDAVLPSEVHR